MEFQDVLRHRRMVRNFQSRSVPDATLRRLLRMARRAPSAGHTQPLELVVVRAPEVRRRLAAATWSRGSRPDAGDATVAFCGDLLREAERYGPPRHGHGRGPPRAGWPEGRLLMLNHFIQSPVLLGLAQAAVAAVLVLAVAWFARLQEIHLERETIVALIRGLGQISLIGFLLAAILRGPAILGVLALVLMIGAAGSIAADRTRKVPGARPAAAFGIAVGSTVVIAAMTAVGVIDLKIASLVPVGSMIVNGAMNASAQTLERFGADVLAHTGQIEAALALGAAPADAAITHSRNAVSASLIPSVNSMRSLGIVWIPGLMAGMLLTGSDPVYAAIYQSVVVAMIHAASGLAALGTISIVRRRVFSSAEQLILRPALVNG